MTHLSLPFPLHRSLLRPVVTGAVVVTACGPPPQRLPPSTGAPAVVTFATIAACNPPWTGGIEWVPRDRILAWARQLPFMERDPSLSRLYGFPEGAQINRPAGLQPEGACWPPPRGCIIARLTTGGPQTALGIAAGTSYVWADSAGGSARAMFIPEDLAAPVVVHRLGHHTFTRGSSPPTIRPGPGACTYCGDTCWCYAPTTDTARYSILRLPGDTGLVGGPPRL